METHAFPTWGRLNQSSPSFPRNIAGSFMQPDNHRNEGQTLWLEEACVSSVWGQGGERWTDALRHPVSSALCLSMSKSVPMTQWRKESRTYSVHVMLCLWRHDCKYNQQMRLMCVFVLIVYFQKQFPGFQATKTTVLVYMLLLDFGWNSYYYYYQQLIKYFVKCISLLDSILNT